MEIAGNDDILLTALVPQAWTYHSADAEVLFSTPVLTEPLVQRIAVRCPVRSLHAVLNELTRAHVRIEHVYDF